MMPTSGNQTNDMDQTTVDVAVGAGSAAKTHRTLA